MKNLNRAKESSCKIDAMQKSLCAKITLNSKVFLRAYTQVLQNPLLYTVKHKLKLKTSFVISFFLYIENLS